MNTCTSYRTFKHFGILDGIAFTRISRKLRIPQCRRIFDGIGQVHLSSIRQSVWDSLTECICLIQRKFLYTGNILDGILGCHTTISDNMRTILMPILIHHPSEHFSTTIIIKVGINIRKIDTVWIQETLKQQVIFQWIYLGNTQTVSYHRTCGRTTTRTYNNPQFFTCCTNKVGHYQEVTRETHRLHDMQLKVDMLIDIFRQRITI